MGDTLLEFPNSPLTNVVYCPNPLLMTDEEIEREMPRSRWLFEMSDLANSFTHEQPLTLSLFQEHDQHKAENIAVRNGRANA